MFRLNHHRPRANDCFHRRRFDRRRRADALALGNVRLDKKGRAAGECHAVLAREHMEDARDIGRPVARRVGGEPGPHGVVRTVWVADHVERHVAPALDAAVPDRCDRDPARRPRADSARASPREWATAAPVRPSNRRCPPITSSRPGARATMIGPPAVPRCPPARRRRSRVTRRRSRIAPGPAASWGTRTWTQRPSSFDQAPPGQRSLQDGLDQCSEHRVRIADPADVGRHVERRAERPAALIGDRYAKLARDELRAEIVRMTTQRRRRPGDRRSNSGRRSATNRSWPAISS